MLLKDRTVFAASLGLALIALMGLYRPRDWDIGVPDETMTAQRMLWNRQFDMVIGGDSRTHLGVAPTALNREWGGGLRIANFGFDSIGYENTYLDHLERILDKNSPCKTILLGLTPRTLTPETHRQNQYLYLRGTSESRQHINLYLGRILHFFRPYNLKALFFESDTGTFAIRKPDGWVAGWRVPADETLSVPIYRKAFVNNKASKKLEDNLLARIRQWSAQGITVLAFKPPVSPAIQTIEKQLSGFDEAGFIRKFRQAGGIWLETDADKKYATYDGSHLAAPQAVAFSQDLARTLEQAHPVSACR